MVSFQDAVEYQNKFQRSCEWMSHRLGIELTKYKRLKDGLQEAKESDLERVEKFLIKERFNTDNDERVKTIKDSILNVSENANRSLSEIITEFKALVNDDGLLSLPDKSALRQMVLVEKSRLALAIDTLIETIEKA